MVYLGFLVKFSIYNDIIENSLKQISHLISIKHNLEHLANVINEVLNTPINPNQVDWV